MRKLCPKNRRKTNRKVLELKHSRIMVVSRFLSPRKGRPKFVTLKISTQRILELFPILRDGCPNGKGLATRRWPRNVDST